MKYFSPLFFSVLLFIIWSPSSTDATPEYSARSGQGCRVCHITPEGGSLTGTGLEYAASGYVWPPKGGYRVIGPIRKSVRFIIGLFHIIAAFLWFGTILYVHILLRPAYASKGLPKGELSLGMISMFIVGATGVLLSISRIKSIDVMYTSPWGVTLLVKIVFYLIMVSSALFIVIFISPKLKKDGTRGIIPHDSVFDPLSLSTFDGRDGTKAFIAYSGKVYDVTDLKLWKNGLHMKHQAGADLTNALPKAPHGREKLEQVPVVGAYDVSKAPPKTMPQKTFYFIAYMNLVIVFLVLITISYWRWGI